MLRQVEALYPCPNISLSDEHDIVNGEKIIMLRQGELLRASILGLGRCIMRICALIEPVCAVG